MSKREIVELTPLTDDEMGLLNVYEETVCSGIRDATEGFLRAGAALREIRDGKLFRVSHPTFEEYVKDRWGIEYRTAKRYIDAQDAVKSIEGVAKILPVAERQVRPLTSQPVEVQAEAWVEAVEEAGGSQPTGPQVEEAVRKARRKRGLPTKAGKTAEAAEHAQAVLEATTPDPETTPDPAGHVEPETPAPTEEEYLALCPAREKLTGDALRRFDADAMFYRATYDARALYRDTARAHLNGLKKGVKGGLGGYMDRYQWFMASNDPTRWDACTACEATGKVGGKKCPACKGRAYVV